MRILLDTNIFISREDAHVLPNTLQQLLVLFNQLNVTLLIHPLSRDEITHDSNLHRREIMLSKIQSYPSLINPPNPTHDSEYLRIVSSEKNSHELVDNHIIYAIYRDATDYLITEDKGIHKKASKLGIDSRILLISEALIVFQGHIQKDSLTSPPALKNDLVYNLNINDPFFNSLKSEYPEFKAWFVKISKEGRKCLVHYKGEEEIGALLIYKLEDEIIDTSPPLPKKKRVKLSTFKVTQLGYKIGELFIKQAVDIAVLNNISEIYLTHFIQPSDRLSELITEFGFYKCGINQRGEEVYLKKLIPEKDELLGLSPFDITKRFFPSYYDGESVNKYVVPIRPNYHSRLFTNYTDRQRTLEEYAGYFIVEGNTIKKAYICHSPIKRLAQGDIIIFYISGRKRLVTIGIVEAVYTNLRDSQTIAKQVGKRTVYTLKEIEKIAERSSLVILFWQYFHLSSPISLTVLNSKNIIRGAPMSIRQLSDSAYQQIKEVGGIDQRFTFN